MSKSTFMRGDNFDEEVIYCLERQIIPAWERYGMDRLAVSENTMREFRDQGLPDQMNCREKKRQGKRVLKRQQVHGVSSVIESWPEDDQQSIRFPVLMYVRSGQAEVQVGDYVVQCPQEHFLLFRPGVPRPAGERPHLEGDLKGKQCEVWWFHSTGNNDFVALSVCYSEAEQHINSGHYYIVSDSQTSQLFYTFAQEAMAKMPYYSKTTFASLQTFLFLFLREIKSNRFHNRGVDNLPKSASLAASPIEMARQYICKNLNHPLTIDIVAQAVFMTRTKFTRQFYLETGQTFREYLIAQRMEEAKGWLLREDCAIEVVCKFVGLKGSRFHQLFKQHFGVTPTEFRKAQKKYPKS